jgi:hypothetical protein
MGSFCKKHPLGLVTAFIVSAVVAVLLHASILKYQYYFGMYHDDGVYLVSAESLAKGHGYRILSLPGAPLQTKYPFAYPLWLSLLVRVLPEFPDNLLGLETVQVVLAVSAVTITAAYLICTRKVTYWLGLAIAAATLLNIRFIDFAPMVMSDLTAALLAAACLWCAENQSRRSDSFKPWTAILLAAAILTRTQAVILVPTLVIYFAARKRYKSIAAVAAALVLSLAPLVWWQSQNSSSAPEISFYTNYLKHSYGTLPPLPVAFGAALANVQWSTILQVNTYFPGLEQIPYERLSPVVFLLLYNVIYYVMAFPLLVGLLVLLRRTSLPALYFLFTAISLSIWPAKLEWRHVLPLLVFGYYFYFVGFRFLFSKCKHALSRNNLLLRRIGVASSVLFCSYLVVGAAVLSFSKLGWSAVFAEPLIPATASDLRDAVTWVKANTPDDAVFVCNNDPVFYLYSNRRAILPSRMELWRFVSDKFVDADSLRQAIDFSHATYVMNEPIFRSSGFAYTQLSESIAALEKQRYAHFLQVFQTEDGLIRIYKIEKPI